MSRDYAKKSQPSRSTHGGATRSGADKPTKAKQLAGKTTVKRQAQTKAPTRRATPKAARPSDQSGRLSVRWVLSLALIGGFAGFIVYLNSLPVADSTGQRGSASTPDSSAPAETAADAQGRKEDRFQFYDMLPDSEVVPPRVDEYDPGPAADERDFRYMVQTGSFRGLQDAERQRAQIAFQGLGANVQKITLDSGSVWYRVNVGPFNSRSKMNSAIDKLVSISIQPLVRKVPKEG